MMLNDVEYQNLVKSEINDIEDSEIIHISKIRELEDEDEKIKVYANLPKFILKEFYENKIKEKGEIHLEYDDSWDEQIVLLLFDYNQKMREQHHTSSLLFDGRPPRKDVWEKLRKIETSIEIRFEDLSDVNWLIVKDIIKKELGNVDPRTHKKYVNCIYNFLNNTQKSPRNGLWYSLEVFCEMVKEKAKEFT